MQLNDFKYIKWLDSSIWLIDEILTGITNLGQNGAKIIAMNDYSTLPNIPGVKPHHQMQFCVTPMTLKACGQLDESDIQWWIKNLHWLK